MKLTGKVTLITGAGSGIGKAAALVLAREGATIGALGRTPAQLHETVSQIEACGGQALVLTADVSKPDQVERAVDKLVQKYERLDAVFANAGINGVWAPVEEITPEEWESTIGINLKGTFLTVKYSVPHLKKTRGSIVICSSVQGTRIFSVPGSSVYATSKAAQVSFAKKIAVELGPSGVRVNVVCPGWIKSEIDDNTFTRNTAEIELQPSRSNYPKGTIPLTGGTPADAEEVAKLVAFLVSEDARHISGTEVWIDGTESLVVG